MEIILASGSPRRKQLLETMGLCSFRVMVPDFDEDSIALSDPARLVEALSQGKAAAAARTLSDPKALILAADTVVALRGEILGKPADPPDAFRMLTSLSRTSHQVYTGFTVLQGGRCVTEHEVTSVTFRPLSPKEIRAYIDTGEPMDKAGAYGIQGLGSLLVEKIQGDFFNVMGLPICHLGRVLRSFGVDPLTPSHS